MDKIFAHLSKKLTITAAGFWCLGSLAQNPNECTNTALIIMGSLLGVYIIVQGVVDVFKSK